MGSEQTRLQYHGARFHKDPNFRHKKYGVGDMFKEGFGGGRKRHSSRKKRKSPIRHWVKGTRVKRHKRFRHGK